MGQIISTPDLKKMILEAAELNKKELILHGFHFEEIDLRNEKIPLSLDLDDSIIDGYFILISADFGGDYISLDRAIIKGSLSLSWMKTTGVRRKDLGIGLYLRGTTVKGKIDLSYTRLNTLVVYGCNYSEKIDLAGTPINRLFAQGSKYDIAEIKRLKKEAQEKRRAGEFSA